jgi:hypothetical protein
VATALEIFDLETVPEVVQLEAPGPDRLLMEQEARVVNLSSGR